MVHTAKGREAATTRVTFFKARWPDWRFQKPSNFISFGFYEVNDAKSLTREGIARSLFDELLTESRLYTGTKEFRDLLDFVVRFRDFSPFNSMLLQIQKPGLRHAASARDLQQRFERRPRYGARPLLILIPFGPIGLVYDTMETEGRPLPEIAAPFRARGTITRERVAGFENLVQRSGVKVWWLDQGDNSAGCIRLVYRGQTKEEPSRYEMCINKNHEPAVQFSTFAHELAHLFLGHLGLDVKLGIPSRSNLHRQMEELEAECVAYLVCMRNDVVVESASYLARFVNDVIGVDSLDLYQIMRAAGRVEAVLQLSPNNGRRTSVRDNGTPRLL